MASIDTSNGKGGKKGKPTKQTLRVDFTPMVDMNMLLITFFMFCTTLSIPQVMDIAMPADGDPTPVPESKSMTLILGEDDKVYYYEGTPNYEDYASLKNIAYSDIRNVLLEKNNESSKKIRVLKQKLHKKEISNNDFKAQVAEIKKSKESITVLVKPTKDASYRNLVDALDEMQICGIGKYSIVEMAEADDFLLENYKTRGALTAQAR